MNRERKYRNLLVLVSMLFAIVNILFIEYAWISYSRYSSGKEEVMQMKSYIFSVLGDHQIVDLNVCNMVDGVLDDSYNRFRNGLSIGRRLDEKEIYILVIPALRYMTKTAGRECASVEDVLDDLKLFEDIIKDKNVGSILEELRSQLKGR